MLHLSYARHNAERHDRPARQAWTIGSRVNVGFLKGLLVVAKIPTPGDYAPDKYLLRSDKGAEYHFTPHIGIERIN